MGLKEAIKKFSQKQAQKRAGQKEIRSMERTELHKARLQQAKIFAQQRAKIEREQKVKMIRSKASSGGGGLGSAFARRINIAATNLGYAKPSSHLAPRTQIKRKKKKSKKKTKKRIHYPQAQQPQQNYNPFY